MVFLYLLVLDFVQFSPAKIFFGGMFEELSASAKICHVATNHPHFEKVGDERKFV